MDIKYNLNKYFRKYIILPYKRLILKNHDFSLLSNNCNGACILHDLNLKFNSPFVNLWLYPKDFIKYCSNIEHYKSCELVFVNSLDFNVDYPVAKLDDIYIFFMHYTSEQEAKSKWIERQNRISDRICILFTARDGWKYDDLEAIDNLPYPKRILVNHRFPEIKSSVYISGFDDKEEVGILSEWDKNRLGHKYYDLFDYVGFFNSQLR